MCLAPLASWRSWRSRRSRLAARRCSAQAPDQRARARAVPRLAGGHLRHRRPPGPRKADDRIGQGRPEQRASSHLRLGFLSLRIGELGGQSHYDDAASEFQWAIDLQPDWPYAWYGMGLAEYGVGDSQISFVTGLKTMLGKDALTRSAVAFAKSAEVDPAFVRGLVELSNTALRQRVNIKLGVALDALRARPRHPPRATIPRCCSPGGGSSARWATATPPWRRSRATSSRARTGAWASSRSRAPCSCSAASTGSQPYYEGAAIRRLGDGRGLSRPTSPRSPRDSVLREFDQTQRRAAGRLSAAVLGQTGTTPSSGPRASGFGSIIAGSSTRARTSSSPRSTGTTTSSSAIAPAAVTSTTGASSTSATASRPAAATYAAPGLEPNESWRYSRPDGDLIFHFVAREDVQDFKLVESLFDVLGFSNAIALRADRARRQSDGRAADAVPRAALADLPAAAVGRPHRHRPLPDRGAGGGTGEHRGGTTTDSYELTFPTELKVTSEVLAVGRDSAGSLVQIAYAIAGSSLEPVTVTRGYLYSVRVRFVATDRTGKVVASLDTTRHFVSPAPVPTASTSSAARRHGAARAVRLSARHSAGRGGRRRPPARYGPRGPADLGLPLPQRPGARQPQRPISIWRRTADDTVTFNPLRTFKRDEDMDLYYEVEGLSAGSTLRRCGSRCGRKAESGGLFKKIFGGGRRRSASSSRSRAPSR